MLASTLQQIETRSAELELELELRYTKPRENTTRLPDEAPFILIILAASYIDEKDFDRACIYFRKAISSLDQAGFTEKATEIREIVAKLEKFSSLSLEIREMAAKLEKF